MKALTIQSVPREVNKILEDYLSSIQLALKKNLIGIYLYGSLVYGDFDAAISDIDLLVVTDKDISRMEFYLLDEIHTNLMNQFHLWHDRIDIVYISSQALKAFKSHKCQIAVISPGEVFTIKIAEQDWLMNWYLVRENSITLFGPDPQTIIQRISKDEFLKAVKSHVFNWRNWVSHTKTSLSYQAYAVLTICRAVYTLTNGQLVSKKRAAEWAINHFPEWKELINNALSWRLNQQNEIVNPMDTHPDVVMFVNFITQQLD